MNRRVIDRSPALGHHLFEMTQAQRIRHVPVNAEQHHVQRIMQPFEHFSSAGLSFRFIAHATHSGPVSIADRLIAADHTGTPILDWFHISMRVRHLEQIGRGLLARSETEKYTKKPLRTYVNRLRWCFWHANAVKAEQRMRQILLLCRTVVAQTARFARSLEQLDYSVGELFAYLESNSGSTITYGKHYREHRPISTAMAESAVNQVINARMCKHQHMRWRPHGAHFFAHVRRVVINGDLAARLAAYRARLDEVPEDVARFLEFMQQAEEAEPHVF
jgi:hypothetical protein